MLIYSPMPPELIWEGYDEFKPQYEEINLDGILIQIEPLGNNHARVVRIFSTDPPDYLNSLYQPGNIIRYELQNSSQTLTSG